jgi:peptidoglycan/LPS O-acetylase OafA/YrhL
LGPGADIAGVMVNPLAYLYLFALGMATRLAWGWLRSRARVGMAVGTALELGALSFLVWNLFNNVGLIQALNEMWAPLVVPNLWWVPPLQVTTLSFPLLILVMALRQGLLSRALSWPFLVLLGEISYSVYLIHVPIRSYLNWACQRMGSFGAWWNALPGLVQFWAYGLGCLLAAWALWRFVECPARTAARAWWQSREADVTPRQWSRATATVAVLATLVMTGQLISFR